MNANTTSTNGLRAPVEVGINHHPQELVLSTGMHLTCDDLERAAVFQHPLTIDQETLRVMHISARRLRHAHEYGQDIYGLTTGFGPHVRYQAAEGSIHGLGLLSHLGAGFGDPAPETIVRASVIARTSSLVRGCSGIDPEVALSLLRMINAGIIPIVPEVGSVGASGDLIPLAHVARALSGEGRVIYRGQETDAQTALRHTGLKPLQLSGRDALALVNGTAFMTAYAAIALAQAERLIQHAEDLTGWIYASLDARTQALDPRLHLARGHDGQTRSAANILRSAQTLGAREDRARPLQEVYSVRCAPQILGACRDNLDHARTVIQRELNGVNDNPVTVLDDNASPEVLHGGNFQGQQIAFASDAINNALVQAAVLADRQIDVLLNPDLNGNAPLLLAWQPGATSGVAGAQITSTGIVADMRNDAGPCSTLSIPTNGRNQDIVSMGTTAARAAQRQTERLAGVLGVLVISLVQLRYLRDRGRATGTITPLPDIAHGTEGFEQDRALRDDIAALADRLLAVQPGNEGAAP